MSNKDFFEHKANEYDKEDNVTKNVSSIAENILKTIPFSKELEIMDFGSGTGLLLQDIAPHVKKITAIDVSKSMTDVLKSKSDKIDCDLEILELDLTKEELNTEFDVIISSMTVHHIKDINPLFTKLFNSLKKGGKIAIADLDTEDGSFHTSDTGVFHLGFDRVEFLQIAKNAGFKNLKMQTASTIQKPYGEYSVFLLTGEK